MSSLTELLKKYNLETKKSWGQHFLSDRNILRAMAGAIEAEPLVDIIELGAGPGVLTSVLCESGRKITAVERDRGFVELLQSEFKDKKNMSVLAADAKKINVKEISGENKVVVVGNLPYNIASPIIFNLLRQRENILQLVFMLQIEMANRIVAAHGSKIYGALSVLVQGFAAAKLVKKVPAGAFMPPPKVDSAIVSMKIKSENLSPTQEKALFKIVNASFSSRRKQIKNNLVGLYEGFEASGFLLAHGIEPTKRAEDIPVQKYIEMAKSLSNDLG